MVTESFHCGPKYRLPDSRFPLPIPLGDPATGNVIHRWINAASWADGEWNEYRDSLDASF